MQNSLTTVLRTKCCTGPMFVYMCVCAWQHTCMYILICAFHLRLYSRKSMTYKELYSILPAVIRRHDPWPCERVGLVNWRPLKWLSPSQIQSFSNFPVVRDMTPSNLVCGDFGFGGIVCQVSEESPAVPSQESIQGRKGNKLSEGSVTINQNKRCHITTNPAVRSTNFLPWNFIYDHLLAIKFRGIPTLIKCNVASYSRHSFCFLTCSTVAVKV
jgi:hypothetical protein